MANGSRISFDGSQILSNRSGILNDKFGINDEGFRINSNVSKILDNKAWNTNERFRSGNNKSWNHDIGSQIPENGFGIDDEEASWIGSAVPLGGFLGGLTAG